MRGDMARFVDRGRHADVFTLLRPKGGPVTRHEHRAETLRASPALVSHGSAKLEHVETHAWGDTLVLAMIERQHGRVDGGPEQRHRGKRHRATRTPDERGKLVPK